MMTISKRHLVLAVTVVLLGGAGLIGWHLYRDHQNLHRMISFWNVYGETIQETHSQRLEQLHGSRGIKPAERRRDPALAAPAQK